MKKRILTLIMALCIITSTITFSATAESEYKGPVIAESSAAYDFFCFMSNSHPELEHKQFPEVGFEIIGSPSYRICKNIVDPINDTVFVENECTVKTGMPFLWIYRIKDNTSLRNAYNIGEKVNAIDDAIILSSEDESYEAECTLPEGTYIFEAPYGSNTGFIRVVVDDELFASSFEVWEDKKYDNLTFRLQDGEATLIHCDIEAKGELDIPADVDGHPVTTILDDAFISCDNITSINLPKTVNYIEAQAIGLLNSLTAINVDAENEEFSSSDGVLFNKNMSCLIQYPMAKPDRTYTIPDTVNSIGFCSFAGSSLEEVIIPDSVSCIDAAAFAFSEKLSAITLPASITLINEKAFYQITTLENVYYQGTEEEWNNINFGEYNIPLFMAAIEFKDTIKVYLNDEKVVFAQFPIIRNDRTLVPMRTIFEALGAAVKWDEENSKVSSTKGVTTIEMTIGNNVMYKNGEAIILDVAPMIAGSEALAPVRAIAEGFECKVDWDAENRTVVITEYK